MNVRALASLVAVVLGFAALGTLAADAANPAGFSPVLNPLTELPAAGALEGVSCTSPSHCVAVGLDAGYQPLVLAGDPSTWGADQAREVSLGNAGGTSDLNVLSVSCTASMQCAAVGSDGEGQPFALTGDLANGGPVHMTEFYGLPPSIKDPPYVYGGPLSSITCPSSTKCVAVGGDAHGFLLVLAGDPATWDPIDAGTIPTYGKLESVTCTSVSSCLAVGQSGSGGLLVLSGDPSTWGAQPQAISLGSAFGYGGQLRAVACPSPSSCIAVGDDKHGQPLILAGDPATWDVAQVHEITLGSSFGSSGQLRSVACPTVSSCTAVGVDGRGQPLVLKGDPATTWTAAQAQEITLDDSFASAGRLNAIACPSASTCVATGSDAKNQPLVLSGDPSTWGADQAQEIGLFGAPFGLVRAPATLTCVSNTSCLELGRYFDFNINPAGSYLIQGSPATWDHAAVTRMAGIGRTSVLDGNACPSPAYCVAVGQDGRTQRPLVLTGDPATWGTAHGRVIALGRRFGSRGSLADVACSSMTSCVAVGQGRNNEPFVLVGNPATWTSANARELKLGAMLHSTGSLVSVTCTSRTACVAVGYDGENQEPLVFSGNPAKWTGASAKQVTMTRSLGRVGELWSVACVSSTYCVAVGDSGGDHYRPLVLRGNPATWTAKKALTLPVAAPHPTTVAGDGLAPTNGTGDLVSVGCDAKGYCVTVGGDNRFAPIYLAGRPRQWSGHPLVRPEAESPSFVTAELTTTSCTRTACFAGGYANGGDYIASFSGG